MLKPPKVFSGTVLLSACTFGVLCDAQTGQIASLQSTVVAPQEMRPGLWQQLHYKEHLSLVACPFSCADVAVCKAVL